MDLHLRRCNWPTIRIHYNYRLHLLHEPEPMNQPSNLKRTNNILKQIVIFNSKILIENPH